MAEARSLADIKLDNAYKFGAGRYLQEAGALNLLGGEVARLGKKALVIAGPRALAATEGKAEKSLKDAGVEFELSLYPDQNTYERAKEHALQALTTGCQVIVGVGGGRIMDQAKATAHFAGDLPIVEVPTSIATCAAFAPLSVMYTAEGASLGSLRYDHEVNAIVMDMDVICKEPPRYAASGIMDGMAKMIEIQNGRSEILLDDVSIGLFTAYTIAEMAYHVYEKEAHQACHDIAEGKLTKAVEDIAYLNVAVAGIVSGYTDDLLLRAADVCLKEGRKVVIVPREMPMSRIHLRNIKEAADYGCVVVPPVLTFYNGADTVEKQIQHIVGKILMQFHISYRDFVPWQGGKPMV